MVQCLCSTFSDQWKWTDELCCIAIGSVKQSWPLDWTEVINVFVSFPVTGSNVHLINAILSSVCVFYTMAGGVKAVVWTDVLQGVVMFASSLVVVTIGELEKLWKEFRRLYCYQLITRNQTCWKLLVRDPLGHWGREISYLWVSIFLYSKWI